MKNITVASSALWQAENVDDPPIFLLKIEADGLPDSPVHITPRIGGVKKSGGAKYDEFALEVSLPDDGDRRAPRVELRMSNVELKWIEQLVGNEITNAKMTYEIVRKSQVNVVDYSQKFDLESIQVKGYNLTMNLSNYGWLRGAAVRLIFNNRTVPAAVASAA